MSGPIWPMLDNLLAVLLVLAVVERWTRRGGCR